MRTQTADAELDRRDFRARSLGIKQLNSSHLTGSIVTNRMGTNRDDTLRRIERRMILHNKTLTPRWHARGLSSERSPVDYATKSDVTHTVAEPSEPKKP
jgi:hypothetical protein